MIYIMLFLNISFLVLGQTLWKIGLKEEGIKLSVQGILRCLFNPYVFAGLFIYAVATIIWLYILSKADLSMVYPLQSLCYVAAAFVAMIIFREHLPLTRWAGISIIIIGAYLVSIK